MSKNKHPDLTPWLDYFKMLQRYEAKGFLEVKPAEHEAYITRAALLTLTPTPALPEGEGDAANNLLLQGGQRGAALADTLRNIRAYAVWLEAALPTPSTETAAANSQLSARPLVARKARTLNYISSSCTTLAMSRSISMVKR